MASSVKRFIPIDFAKLFVLMFVALAGFFVKPTEAKSLSDEVIAITLPFELTLKKAGSVRLAGLLYDANSTALGDLLKKGDKVRVHIVDDQPDRYGRKPIQLYGPDKNWIQGELVRKGLATPYPYPGEETAIRNLYMLEKPQAIAALNHTITVDAFAIVQGTVINVAEVKGITYLNFGDNWRDDFTIRINKKKKKLFGQYGIDLPALKGQLLRIRGWVIEKNGPMIDASHPAQIELLER